MLLATRKKTVLCALTTSLVVALGVAPPATADATNPIGITARDNTPHYAPGTLGMRWGIKQSFINYTGGFTHVLDGAVADGTWVTWPLNTPATVTDRGDVTAQYGGTVNFLKYCDDGAHPARGECKLDFTGFDPKIEYNTVTNTGALYLTIHNYALENGIDGPGRWVGPEMIKFATLDGANAKYSIHDGVVTFDQVGAFLTKEGAATLPTYSEGLRIDDVSFSYAATTVATSDRAPVLSNDSNRTELPFNGNSSAVFHTQDGHALVTGVRDDEGTKRNYAAIVDDEGIVVAQPKDYDEGVQSPLSATNGAGDTYYWRGGDNCSIKQAPISAAGLGDASTLFSLPTDECGDAGILIDFMPNPATNTIGVVSMHEADDTRSYTFRVLDASGAVVKKVALPNSHELFGTAASDESYLEPYGSPFSFNGKHSLGALDDGTFISVYDRTITTEDGKKTGGIPVHITPDAATPATVITAMADQFYDMSHSYRNVATGHGLVVIYNNNYGNHPNYQRPEDKLPLRTGVYSYSNGTFTKKALTYLGNDWDNLVTIDVVAQDKLLIASANKAPKAGFFDANTLTLEEPFVQLSNMKNLESANLPTIARAGDSYIQLGSFEKDYVDYVVTNRLYVPAAGRTPTDSVEPVRVSPTVQPPAPTTTDAPAPTSTPKTSTTSEPAPHNTPAPTTNQEPSAATDGLSSPGDNLTVFLPVIAGVVAFIAANITMLWGFIAAIAAHNGKL